MPVLHKHVGDHLSHWKAFKAGAGIRKKVEIQLSIGPVHFGGQLPLVKCYLPYGHAVFMPYQLPGLSPSAGCQQNSPTEKEVIAALILAGYHSVKDVQQTVSRLCTYNHSISEPC